MLSYAKLAREHAWSQATIDELKLEQERVRFRRQENNFLAREVGCMTRWYRLLLLYVARRSNVAAGTT